MQTLAWGESTRSWSFWLLLSVLILMGLFGWAAARYDTRRRKTLTEAEFLGIALDALVDALVEATKQDILDGKIRSLDDVVSRFGSSRRSPP